MSRQKEVRLREKNLIGNYVELVGVDFEELPSGDLKKVLNI
jgi:hypothetical protein